MYLYFIFLGILLLIYIINSAILVPIEVEKFNQYISEKNIPEAEKVLKKIPINRKNVPNVIFGIGVINEYKEEWYLALYEFKRLLVINTYSAALNKKLILEKILNIYKKIKQPEELINICYQLLEIDTNHIQANFEIGKRLFELKNYKVARVYLDRIYPEPGKECMQIMLELSMHEENYDEALKIIENIIDVGDNTDNIKMNFVKSKIMFEAKKYQEVVELLELDSENVKIPRDVLLMLAIAYYFQENYDLSLKLFKENLLNYSYENSKLVLEARYLFVELLFINRELDEAFVQINYISQKNTDYLDLNKRLETINFLIKSQTVSAMFKEPNIEDVVEGIFHYKSNSYRSVISQEVVEKLSLTKPWILQKVQESIGDFYYLYFSFNYKFLNKKEINEIDAVITKMDRGGKINLIIMSLNGLGPEAESFFIKKYNRVSVYNRKHFIKYIEKNITSII